MNTLNNYISEKLFTDIDSQMDETEDIYIKNKLIEILKIEDRDKDSIKIKNGIINIKNEQDLTRILYFTEKNYRDIKKLLRNKYKFGYVEFCCINTRLVKSPSFLKNTEFKSFDFFITDEELSNWDISINNVLSINCRKLYKIKNFNIKAANKIKIELRFDNYDDERRIENVIKGINIDKLNYIKNISIYIDRSNDNEIDIKQLSWVKLLKNKFKGVEIFISILDKRIFYDYEDIK